MGYESWGMKIPPLMQKYFSYFHSLKLQFTNGDVKLYEEQDGYSCCFFFFLEYQKIITAECISTEAVATSC